MQKPKRAGGRPRRDPKPGERVPLGLRVTPELKERLDQAAQFSGRSQSQEAELRLELSFEREDLLPEVMAQAYGRHLAGILMAVGNAMKMAGAAAAIMAIGQGREPTAKEIVKAFTRWTKDGNSFDQSILAAIKVLIWARGPSSKEFNPTLHGDELDAAGAYLYELETMEPPTPEIAQVRSLIGHDRKLGFPDSASARMERSDG